MATKKFGIVKNEKNKAIVYYGKNGIPHYRLDMRNGKIYLNHKEVNSIELTVDGKGNPKDEVFKKISDVGFLRVIEEEKRIEEEEITFKKREKKEVKFNDSYGS